MILSAAIHGEIQYAENPDEMAALIDEVIENLQPEDPDYQGVSAGEIAALSFGEQRAQRGLRNLRPDNILLVSVNVRSGFGGLTWHSARKPDGISEYLWLSDNPSPPEFDPRVVLDPHVPSFFDPKCTFPSERIREVLEEYCRAGTGDRPECISWVRGRISGKRLD
ncbi:Imm1 family immunity protein [Nocardia sp. alder85J]|uniref:Imm1 family immunity protein n=1 Tax=Nocardia sp. alder85J TaxID=2862949 RepID=UPI001CD75CB4|nr:Imm1 family immunity protein [Nocardia sp. alder85J]MCX4094583.1 Imm1 family immunity protein [Nocardia sp. alder85J]